MEPINHEDRLKYVARQFALRKGRKPTEEELASALNISVDQVRKLRNTKPMPSQQEDDDSLEAIRPFVGQDSQIISSLSPRERMVLRMRLGLEHGQEFSISQISELLGLPCHLIRRTLQSAIARLCHRCKPGSN